VRRKIILLTEEFVYIKSKLSQLGIAVALIFIFTGLLLTLQNVFADEYEYVICANKVWYPTGTDCEVAEKKYYEYWNNVGEKDSTNNNKIGRDNEDFNKYLESRGIDPDEDYHWLRAEEQKKIEQDFKETQNSKKGCKDKGFEYSDNGCQTKTDENNDRVIDKEFEIKDEQKQKKYCANSGNWEDGECKIDDVEEKTAYEDAVCDNEDADTTNIKMCMSEEREHHYVDVKIEKEVCKDEGFEWKQNGGCDTKGDEKKWDEIYYKVGQALAEIELNEDEAKEIETTDVREYYNPNDVDSDGDGIYDDEELSEEEEKELAKSQGADETTDKEKKKLDEENQKVVDEWVKDELKSTEDELRAMTETKPDYDKQEEFNESQDEQSEQEEESESEEVEEEEPEQEEVEEEPEEEEEEEEQEEDDSS
jgi:hypothetical protein